MGKDKLKKEKTTMLSFIVVSFVVLAASLIFLVVSTRKEELGGTIICAMLTFISGYAFIVFIMRLIRYSRISVMQNMIMDEKVYSIAEIQDRVKVSTKTVQKDIEFLIDNGYLDGYELHAEGVVNLQEELERVETLKREIYKKYNSNKVEENPEKKERKKRITSDKCPNCGASVEFKNGEADCPYCGNSLNEE